MSDWLNVAKAVLNVLLIASLSIYFVASCLRMRRLEERVDVLEKKLRYGNKR